MFSISRVVRSSSKCLYSKFLTKRNCLKFSHYQFKTQILNSSTLQKLQSFKLLFHVRNMGTIINIKQKDNRFFIEMNEAVAELKYAADNGVMEIIHTIVPKKLAGHGLGKLLAKKALEHAVQHDLVLKISCDFVKYYVNEYEPRYLKYILY